MIKQTNKMISKSIKLSTILAIALFALFLPGCAQQSPVIEGLAQSSASKVEKTSALGSAAVASQFNRMKVVSPVASIIETSQENLQSVITDISTVIDFALSFDISQYPSQLRSIAYIAILEILDFAMTTRES